MKCPNCGSENVNLIHNTSKHGFKGSDACCGYILFGPLGILCGTFGSGKWSKKEFWLCNNCGSRFSNQKIVKYNKKEQANSYVNNQSIEEAYIEPEKIEEVQKPALPENSVYNEDLCAPKTVFNRTEPYSGGLSVESLLKRAKLFLEDSEWEKAYEYSENAIDIDACCAEAYLLKFMAEYNISEEDSISIECAFMIEQIDSLTELENYKKAHRFGNDEMKLKLEKYSNQAVYNYADNLAANADSVHKYVSATEIFERISGYLDSAERAEKLYEKIRSDKYSNALKIMNSAVSTSEMNRAKIDFEELGNYKDSKQLAKECGEKCKELDYNSACKMLDTAQGVKDIRHAQSLLKALEDYKDAAEKVAGCDKKCSDFNYNEACKILENAKTIRNIDKAVELFNQVQGYDDINERLNECETKRGEIIAINKKKLKKVLICASVLTLIIIIIIVVSSAVNRNDTETVENVTDIVSGTESEITTSKASETSVTSETTEVEVTEFGLKNVVEDRKSFHFDGGYIECVEYKYYVLNDYESTTEQINFSVQIKLDDYPDSEKAINDALNEIGNAPTAEVLMASKAPQDIDMGIVLDYHQINSAFTENGLLFVNTYYFWNDGSTGMYSVYSQITTYIFDIRTGKQLKIEQCFKDFNRVKQLAIEYADSYIKENIDYDEPYMDILNNTSWYGNDEWEYDGKTFTIHFGWYQVGDIPIEIPADVIRPYFAYGGEYVINIPSEPSPLSDFEYGYSSAYETSFWMINYNGNDNIIVIPDEIDNLPVVEIAPWAFASCRAKTVIIPDSVTLMSPLTFENSSCDVIYKGKTYLPNQYNDLCDAVNNAETKTAVGYDFKYTEYDREITLNKYIGNDTTIIIPNKINGKPVTCIADAFAYTNVKEVIIPEGVCVLMNGTFACCYNLESITLPSTIYAITGQVFYNCSNLTNIDIPSNLEMDMSISTDSIVGCSGLANFDFPNNISWYELTYGIS